MLDALQMLIAQLLCACFHWNLFVNPPNVNVLNRHRLLSRDYVFSVRFKRVQKLHTRILYELSFSYYVSIPIICTFFLLISRTLYLYSTMMVMKLNKAANNNI
jgi:hypothetical protein